MSQPTQPPPPEQALMQMLFGKFIAKSVAVVADLGVPDHIKDGAVASDKLAELVEANPDGLYRVMRALAAVGVFVEAPGKTFSLTPIGRILRSDVPGSMRAMARWICEDSAWKAWGELGYSVRTGKPSFDKSLGSNVFEHLGRDKHAASLFNDAMTSMTSATAHAVVKAYDFTGAKKVVDVGGGHGGLLASIVAKFPGVRGVLYDLPAVIDTAAATLERSGQKERIELERGSFFENVPAGADIYIMKAIIHDWDDPRCAKILEHCRRAMAPAGKVLVVETLVTERPEAAFAKMLNLEMLVMTNGGRERTEAEFGALFAKAGLRLSRIVATESPVAVLEAVAA